MTGGEFAGILIRADDFMQRHNPDQQSVPLGPNERPQS